MGLSAFELEILGQVLNDYESVRTLREGHLKRPIPEEEVGAALLTLARLGLVDVFFHDVAAQRFVPAGVDEFPVDKLWFMGNDKGIAEESRLAED